MIRIFIFCLFCSCLDAQVNFTPSVIGNANDIYRDNSIDSIQSDARFIVASSNYGGVYDYNTIAIAEFDIKEIEPSSIVSAFLSFSPFGRSSNGYWTLSANIYGYNGDGLLSTSDAFAGSYLNNITLHGGYTAYPWTTFTINVTSFITGATNSNWDFVGFNLRPSETPPSQSSIYNSYSPLVLTIVAIPETSSFALATSLTIALVCALRRTRRTRR